MNFHVDIFHTVTCTYVAPYISSRLLLVPTVGVDNIVRFFGVLNHSVAGSEHSDVINRHNADYFKVINCTTNISPRIRIYMYICIFIFMCVCVIGPQPRGSFPLPRVRTVYDCAAQTRKFVLLGWRA
jgi:hypothetical protein